MPVFPALPAVKPFRINGRLLVSYLDTVEVRSSSLLVPTISFNHLTSLTSPHEAPNGSLSAPNRGGQAAPHVLEEDFGTIEGLIGRQGTSAGFLRHGPYREQGLVSRRCGRRRC